MNQSARKPVIIPLFYYLFQRFTLVVIHARRHLGVVTYDLANAILISKHDLPTTRLSGTWERIAPTQNHYTNENTGMQNLLNLVGSWNKGSASLDYGKHTYGI